VGAVQIWLASVDDVDLAAAPDVFSPQERARADRMLSPGRRRRFLARRWMARTLLARELGKDPGGLVLERSCERCGELHPVSPLVAGSRRVWWSASSSAGRAAVAISGWRVGLDLENRDERPRWERIARRFYSEDEQSAVAGSPTRFLEYWTLKEAYLKALGLGLPGGLQSLECSGLSPSPGGWSTSPAHPGWRFRQLNPEPDFAAAVAVEGAPDGIELRRWPADAGEPDQVSPADR
jgi:4'-phosphopantetheinyl transferase